MTHRGGHVDVCSDNGHSGFDIVVRIFQTCLYADLNKCKVWEVPFPNFVTYNRAVLGVQPIGKPAGRSPRQIIEYKGLTCKVFPLTGRLVRWTP